MVGGFFSGIPASSTTKTGRHDIAEIFMKVALSIKNHHLIHGLWHQFRNSLVTK
jgi:hypothetical protein